LRDFSFGELSRQPFSTASRLAFTATRAIPPGDGPVLRFAACAIPAGIKVEAATYTLASLFSFWPAKAERKSSFASPGRSRPFWGDSSNWTPCRPGCAGRPRNVTGGCTSVHQYFSAPINTDDSDRPFVHATDSFETFISVHFRRIYLLFARVRERNRVTHNFLLRRDLRVVAGAGFEPAAFRLVKRPYTSDRRCASDMPRALF
jgi:hypothetical protein